MGEGGAVDCLGWQCGEWRYWGGRELVQSEGIGEPSGKRRLREEPSQGMNESNSGGVSRLAVWHTDSNTKTRIRNRGQAD